MTLSFTANMNKAKILVVEDETIVALDIESRLNKLGYSVCATVENGAEAIAKALELQPDLVLMDIHLQGSINGIEAAEEIYQKSQIPIIYLTANSDPNTFEKAKITEPLAYIIKPFKERELNNTIELTLSRYRAEKKVKEREEWLLTVLKSIGDGVIISNSNGQVEFLNPVAETLTGWQQSEACGRNTAEVFNIINKTTQTRKENTVVDVPDETILIAKNGAKIAIDDTVAPVKDDRGNSSGMVLVFRDIMERKRSQEALKQQAETLAQANRLKDEFLALVSHELRTPLNAILGWAQLLNKKKVNEAIFIQALASIERNAKAQLTIVEDILDASSIIHGNLRLNKSPIDLIPIANSILEDLRPISEAKGVEVELILDNLPGQILGDSDRLRQVIWNLLSNAIKFTPSGGAIQFRLTSAGNYAQIQIRDTGIGIAPEFLPYVFDRFRQADSSTTRKYNGLGIGLAIASHLVELHGGTVCAASDGEGKGATFTVQLPVI